MLNPKIWGCINNKLAYRVIFVGIFIVRVYILLGLFSGYMIASFLILSRICLNNLDNGLW